MLAHLAYLPRPKFVAIALVAGTAFWSPAKIAFGADTLPIGSLDARATGKVSSADVAENGSLVTGLSVEAAEGVVPEGMIAADANGDGEAPLLRDANRASVFLGAAVTSRLEVTLGLHGSYEHVKPEERDVLFPQDPAVSDLSWRDSTKQTGFSGASLFLKLKLVDWSGLRLAFAPFVESGAGDQATYSLTRSVGPKAGFMTIATYGAEGVADVSLNAGYRYRDPEQLGDVTLRHEQFAKASIRAYATRDLSFFVAGEGRRLMIATSDEIDVESGKTAYDRQESGEVKGGVGYKFSDMEVSAFGGGMPKNAGGFGFGKTTYGVALSMSLGNYRGNRPNGKSIGSEIEKEEEEKAAALAAKDAEAKKAAAAAKPTEDYSEMIGADIDPLEALAGEEAPDFKDVPARQKQYEQDGKTESSDAKVERELKDLKAAEAKAAADREKIEAAERAEARKAAAKRSKEDGELMREYMKEAKKDAEALDSIETDEMEWNGLE